LPPSVKTLARCENFYAVESLERCTRFFAALMSRSGQLTLHRGALESLDDAFDPVGEAAVTSTGNLAVIL
jgi:hypothetical protein